MTRVLVIDDDPVLLTLATCLVEALGHQVVQATQGREGVSLFIADPTDLIVTDIVMPDQEGIETIRAIRAVDPKVPILAMSGSTNAETPWDYLKLALTLGATSTIYKPFTPEAFTAEIRKLLPGTAG
jgi:CheY-like chemotaxis protein